MMEARFSLSIEHHRCRQAGPYALHVAGIMRRGTLVLEPSTVLVDPDGGWSIESGWAEHQTTIGTLSTTIVAPGLRDQHAHIWGSTLLPGFPAFGVTEVRDLGSPAAVRQLELMRHPDCSHPYPRLVFGGPMLHRPGPMQLASAARWENLSDIYHVIHQAAEDGARWQKLYHGFPDQYIPHAVRVAHELGLRVAIHPRPGGARLAAESGVDEIEHVACLPWDLAEEATRATLCWPGEHTVHCANRLWAAESVASASPECFLGVALCPTLVVQQQLLTCVRTGFRLPGVPDWLISDWKRLRIAQSWTDEQLALGELALENMIRFVGRFLARGGRLVIGSDTPNPGVMPGRSLWQELDLLRKVGPSPLELYRQACVDPEGPSDRGVADLVFIDQERVARAAAGGKWGLEPVAGFVLRGCLYLIARVESGPKEKEGEIQDE